MRSARSRRSFRCRQTRATWSPRHHTVIRHRPHPLYWEGRQSPWTPVTCLMHHPPPYRLGLPFPARPDGAAELASNDKIDAALKPNGIGWLWVHLALSDIRCRAWIAQRAPVSEFARDVLAGPDGYLRLDIVGNEIVGVLPNLQQEFAQPGEDFVRLRFVMTERMVITARQRLRAF